MTATPPEHESPVPNPDPPADPAPAPSPRPAPSIHITALIVWLTIFPLVAIVSLVLGPFVAEWHPVMRALVLTLVVVPIAVYWVMPQMWRWYAAINRRRAARHDGTRAP